MKCIKPTVSFQVMFLMCLGNTPWYKPLLLAFVRLSFKHEYIFPHSSIQDSISYILYFVQALESSIAFTQQYIVMNHLIKEIDSKKYFRQFHHKNITACISTNQDGIAYYMGSIYQFLLLCPYKTGKWGNQKRW